MTDAWTQADQLEAVRSQIRALEGLARCVEAGTASLKRAELLTAVEHPFAKDAIARIEIKAEWARKGE